MIARVRYDAVMELIYLPAVPTFVNEPLDLLTRSTTTCARYELRPIWRYNSAEWTSMVSECRPEVNRWRQPLLPVALRILYQGCCRQAITPQIFAISRCPPAQLEGPDAKLCSFLRYCHHFYLHKPWQNWQLGGNQLGTMMHDLTVILSHCSMHRVNRPHLESPSIHKPNG
jgi:hypothetical protein